MKIPRVLTVGGSDSGGGAGIQADLKTFTALKVYGMSALTALTVQNTWTIAGIIGMAPDFVARQMEAVITDIGADAVKTGMLLNAEIIRAVASMVVKRKIRRLVVDPVMVAKGGASLLRPKARNALLEYLFPLALLVTPNIPEAEALSGIAIRTGQDMKAAAHRLVARGAKAVLIKGGHGSDINCVDLLYNGDSFEFFSAPRIPTKNTHGTGCTLSAAITAYLAKETDLKSAVRQAKEYVTGAILHSLPLGKGHGPLDHTWNIP